MDTWANAVALVPAAGDGLRLGRGPKAFLEVGGQSLILRTVLKLRECGLHTLVGVPQDRVDEAAAMLGSLAEVSAGAHTRQETVRGLLAHSSEPLVLVHDATRPFAGVPLIRQVLAAAQRHGAASTFVPPHASVGLAREGFVYRAFPTSEAVLPQSPQAYHRAILEHAYGIADHDGFSAQTTWELVLRAGVKIAVVPGDERNIKITTPFDWEVAQKVVASAPGKTAQAAEGEV